MFRRGLGATVLLAGSVSGYAAALQRDVSRKNFTTACKVRASITTKASETNSLIDVDSVPKLELLKSELFGNFASLFL